MVKKLICFLLGLAVWMVAVLPAVQAAAGADKVRLSWAASPDAVAYELAVISRSSAKRPRTVLVRSDIFTNGVELELGALKTPPKGLWWQVRALDANQQPITRFSSPRRLEKGEFDPATPLLTAQLDRFTVAKLYQVYAWVPVLRAAAYEVQVLSAPPGVAQLSNAVVIRTLTINGASAFDLYDETAFLEEGTYWWRVLARDANGQAIGKWSEARSFAVKKSGFEVAAFGDSITHGGGAISNPPSDPAYDWTTCTGFPVKNLGRSGDTTAMMAGRFESEVLPFKPKLLVIMGGVNDLRGGTAAEEVINNLTVIRDKCRAYGIIPVFVTVTPVNPSAIKRVFQQETADGWQTERQTVNNWIATQQYYVDAGALLEDSAGMLPAALAADGLHPDTRGKAIIGRTVGNYIRAQFKLNP